MYTHDKFKKQGKFTNVKFTKKVNVHVYFTHCKVTNINFTKIVN